MRVIQKKVCLLGHFGVGKTSLVRRFVEDRFDEEYLSTIGIHLSRKMMPRNNRNLELFIWDLAGGENFADIGPHYLLGSTGALVVCDVTRADTLQVMHWYAEQLVSVNAQAKFVFLGNKSDLVSQTAITLNDIEAVCAPYGGRALLTSAKDGRNVAHAFELLAQQIES